MMPAFIIGKNPELKLNGVKINIPTILPLPRSRVYLDSPVPDEQIPIKFEQRFICECEDTEIEKFQELWQSTIEYVSPRKALSFTYKRKTIERFWGNILFNMFCPAKEIINETIKFNGIIQSLKEIHEKNLNELIAQVMVEGKIE